VDRALYRRRTLVGQSFNTLKYLRRIATRFEKRAARIFRCRRLRPGNTVDKSL